MAEEGGRFNSASENIANSKDSSNMKKATKVAIAVFHSYPEKGKSTDFLKDSLKKFMLKQEEKTRVCTPRKLKLLALLHYTNALTLKLLLVHYYKIAASIILYEYLLYPRW